MRNYEKRLTPRRCYHHKRNETTDHWPRLGNRGSRCRSDGRKAAWQAPRKPQLRLSPASAASAAVRFGWRQHRPPDAPPCRQVEVSYAVWAAFCGPFSRVGRNIWLEVTGVFFLLPAIVFAPNLWRMRASWAQGPDHRTFLVTALVVVVFLYLGVSSFWRAGRR